MNDPALNPVRPRVLTPRQYALATDLSNGFNTIQICKRDGCAYSTTASQISVTKSRLGVAGLHDYNQLKVRIKALLETPVRWNVSINKVNVVR